ncbi:MAG: hypothetical protein WD022_01680 [Balneolaceae bacterium]
MSEHDNHNDPLEQFFQKKAEEYDISFREKDWLDLEKKLDHQQAVRSYQRRLRWVAAASILIVSVLGYFTYQNYQQIDLLNKQLDENIASGILPDSTSEISPATPDQQPDTDEKEPTGINENLAENFEETEPDYDRNEAIAQVVTDSIQINDDISTLSDNRAEGGMIASALISTTSASVSSTNDPPATAIRSVSAFQESGISASHWNNYPENITDPNLLSRIDLGLIISPDLSSVGGISALHDPGYKIGLMAGYMLNSNLSLSTGIIHSKVRYSSGSQGYRPPANWSYYNQPDGIAAECFILDIPVNLKYDFHQFNKSRLFATAGLSTYIMLSEDYRFEYDYSTPGQTESLNEKSGKAHLLSNAGFSVGYELDIHQSWNLRVEPFIKLPLQEVGWGNVKLYSVGSFISINYKL